MYKIRIFVSDKWINQAQKCIYQKINKQIPYDSELNKLSNQGRIPKRSSKTNLWYAKRFAPSWLEYCLWQEEEINTKHEGSLYYISLRQLLSTLQAVARTGYHSNTKQPEKFQNTGYQGSISGVLNLASYGNWKVHVTVMESTHNPPPRKLGIYSNILVVHRQIRHRNGYSNRDLISMNKFALF